MRIPAAIEAVTVAAVAVVEMAEAAAVYGEGSPEA